MVDLKQQRLHLEGNVKQ